MKVAVTGASGFLGTHLVTQLQRAGHEVIGVVRSPARATHLPVELRAADILNLPALTAAFADCDAVVANAALAPGWTSSDPQDVQAANVLGAENHLRAATITGALRVIWMSTVAVYRTRVFVLQPESSPQIDPTTTRFDLNNLTTNPHYARTKALAEQLAWRHAARSKLSLTVLRPGPIWGPGDTKLTARYGRMLRLPIVFAPTVALPHIHAEDVALAVVGALANPRSIGRAYNLNGETISPYRFLRTWRNSLGLLPPILPIPLPLTVRFDDRLARKHLAHRPRSVAEMIHGLASPFDTSSP